MNTKFLRPIVLLIVGCIGGCVALSGCAEGFSLLSDPPVVSDGSDASSSSGSSKISASPDETDRERITRIDVRHSSFGMTESEYRIDLEDGAFFKFEITSFGDDYKPRDPEAENEGYTRVSGLSDEKVEDFTRKCNHFRIAKWKSVYMNNDICDGHQWSMVICFSDGTQKEINGSNEYPDGWDEMREAFEDLTGEDILSVSSDWLTD